MKFKKFRELVIGDRFLHQASPHDYRSPTVWDVAADIPEPLDDEKPDGLWKVYTTCGKAFEYPDTTVILEF